MLATLNSRQIVDEIVKDTMKDNDPHDAVQISPDVIRASRVSGEAPTLAPEFTTRPEPKFAVEPKINLEPKISPVLEPQAEAPSVDTAVRVTAADDGRSHARRSAAGRWLRGAFLTFLFAGGSAAATLAWEKHGDTATQTLAQWTPSLASLLPSTSQTAPVAAAQATPPVAQDQAADRSSSPPPAQSAAAATQPDAPPSVESMTRDMAAMAQQIEQLKATIAELKAGQEQMVREMAKPSIPKPIAEAKPAINPPARVSALPPRAPSPIPPPVRKPKPVVSHTSMPAYPPTQLVPPPPAQAAAVPSVAPPVATTQTVADDDGPVVRPPMPVH